MGLIIHYADVAAQKGIENSKFVDFTVGFNAHVFI